MRNEDIESYILKRGIGRGTEEGAFSATPLTNCKSVISYYLTQFT